MSFYGIYSNMYTNDFLYITYSYVSFVSFYPKNFSKRNSII